MQCSKCGKPTYGNNQTCTDCFKNHDEANFSFYPVKAETFEGLSWAYRQLGEFTTEIDVISGMQVVVYTPKRD